MFQALGKTYYEIGDKVTTTKFAGAPAVVIGSEIDKINGSYFYTLQIDVSNHPDGYDENGERIASIVSTSHECMISPIADQAAEVVADQAAEIDARIAASAAEYDFRMYCAEGPGAHAETILANMGAVNDGSRKYWKRALACARLARAAWLRA